MTEAKTETKPFAVAHIVGSIRCLRFHNPASINGPFGEIEIVVGLEEGEADGKMTISTLWGIGTTTTLCLFGTSHKGNVYHFNGVGYTTSLGEPPHKVRMEITLIMDSNWEKGRVLFGEALPEVFDGLPVKEIACHH